jgi:hypothetical protein
MNCPGCGYDPELVVVKRYEFTIPLKWYSQNELRSNTRNNRKYKSVRDKYIVKVGTHGCGVLPADTYRRVYLTRLFANRCRPYDYGNLVGGGKPILDALVWNGLLIDDSPSYVDEYYFQEKNPTGTHAVRVVIEDVRKA